MEFKKKLVLIVYNRLSEEPTDDEKDVITQVEFVKFLLERNGFTVKEFPLTLNFEEYVNVISNIKPDCIFNLVESLDRYESMLCCAPFLFESLNIPYTGSKGTSIAITTSKCMAKNIMKVSDIPTPEWWKVEEIKDLFDKFPVILKPLAMHASQGIEDDSVVKDFKDWEEWLKKHNKEKENFFVEKYVDGREFNLSLIEDPQNGVIVLPVAEIVFSSFPPEKPRIVGYAAKWKENSFEYQNTPRRFLKEKECEDFINKLKDIALRCWYIFSLSGYARVDFRVDTTGNVFVLEVNANPCLSPDAGFIAACLEAGLSYEEVIKKIVYSAVKQNINGKYYF